MFLTFPTFLIFSILTSCPEDLKTHVLILWLPFLQSYNFICVLFFTRLKFLRPTFHSSRVFLGHLSDSFSRPLSSIVAFIILIFLNLSHKKLLWKYFFSLFLPVSNIKWFTPLQISFLSLFFVLFWLGWVRFGFGFGALF